MNFTEWFTAKHPGNEDMFSTIFNSSRKDINSLEEAKAFDLILLSAMEKWTFETRKQFNHLANHFSGFSIGDLGHVLSEKAEIPVEPIIALNGEGVITCTLAGNINIAMEIASRTRKKLTIISNHVPVHEVPGESLNILGYQRHLCSMPELKFIDEFCPDSLSLGKMKSHPHLWEPILRDTEVLYIHGNVLKASEMAGVDSSWPTGIYTEELCQIMKYAGSSLRLSSVIIDLGLPTIQENSTAPRLVAELLWYLLEGMKMKETDHPGLHSHLSEYVVNIGEYDADMVFLKSNLSQRWWLRLDENTNYPYLSCAHEEYQQTIQSDVPDRLLRHLSR